MKNDFLEKMLKRLYENRHFPKYQMERRVDILINIFLHDILREFLKIEISEKDIIPELPIKKEKEGNNLSIDIDYFAYCSSRKTGYLVELKTDSNSCDSGQLNQYQKYTFKEIWNGIKEIRKATNKNSKPKYNYLIDRLNDWGVTEDISLEIVYILPEAGIVNLKIQPNPESKVHLITLERLKNLQPEAFKDEWKQITESGIFDAKKP